MKKYLSLLLAVTVLAVISGCGDNKTKQKLYGTSLVNANSGSSSYTSNPTAASMTALYKVTFSGAGAGSFSSSGAIRRSGAQTIVQGAPSADDGVGLGNRNGNGEYVMADPVLGMTVKVAFKNASDDTVYMNFANVFGSDGLYAYDTESLTSTKYALGGGTPSMEFGLSMPNYIPSIWTRVGGEPDQWFPLNAVDDMNDLESWMTTTSFPQSMLTTVTGAIPGGSMIMTLTTAMARKATDANPLTMSGNGTVTFDTGEVWTITSNLSIGANGPIAGTQTFSSTNGNTGSLLFNSDGSMDGSMSNGGVVIATIHINSDGTGTYTDMATSQTYTITDARPQA
jgi:hypothetical protein